ncbi:uncharacterized protein LOC119675573 [Teleopsis dalmanni]|uniref:uncharacterized protein LOC119675573 n=1 Tax=Teleopsis dalmanni TaxID=139649 RepID=UPI0018CCFAA1|nr:uncharacterized protein LOC119675573 [Teleopsis dalmanni]
MRLSTQTQSSSARLSFNNLEFNKNDSMEQVLNIPENAENKPKLLNIRNKSGKNSYEEENDKSKYMLFHHINENECKLHTNPPQCLRPHQEILLQMQCMKSALSKKEKQVENQSTDIVIDLSKNSVGKPTNATEASSIRNIGCIAETISSGVSSSNQVKQITSIDGFFNRKRGRPPKNRFVEVYKNFQHIDVQFEDTRLQRMQLDWRP